MPSGFATVYVNTERTHRRVPAGALERSHRSLGDLRCLQPKHCRGGEGGGEEGEIRRRQTHKKQAPKWPHLAEKQCPHGPDCAAGMLGGTGE